MTKSDFRKLFIRALEMAARNAAKTVGKPASRSFRIELHAPGSAGGLLSVDEALNHLYLGSDRFFKIIDVAIKDLSPAGVVAFVRASGHPPAEFAKTWDPSGLGPFKEISAKPIEDHRVHTA